MNDIYIETNYNNILLNILLLFIFILDIYINKVLVLWKNRGISTLKYKTLKKTIFLIYLPSSNKFSKLTFVYFRRKFYLVNSLQAKLLIDSNIINLVANIDNLDY